MILVPLSGGIDSAALLWHYSQSREIMAFWFASPRISERRTMLERAAARRVVWWFRWIQKIDIRFEQIELTEDSAFKHLHTWWAVAAYSGIFVSLQPSIEAVASGLNANDARRPGFSDRVSRCKRMARALAGRDFKWDEPFLEKTKPEIYSSMPEHLAVLTYSCWNPVERDGEWVDCGRCGKCLEMSCGTS